MITHRERVQACLRHDPTDRPPVALWRHFPVADQRSDSLAAAHLDFQRTYDFDLLKVTPASSYSVKDWGVEDLWEGNAEGTRRYSKYVIHQPGDWEKLPVLDPSKGYLAAQISCLHQIRQELDGETPILQTVFNALSQAQHLAGSQTMLAHLRAFPDAVEQGLEIITETTRRFIRAVIEAGIDGIFLAIQHAQSSLLSRDEFLRFSKPSDLMLLNAAGELWCNAVHMHGRDIFFDAVMDYPVQIINWHDRETGPSLKQARDSWKGMLCGGLSRETLVGGSPEMVSAEASDAFATMGGEPFMLGTGCVIPITTPEANIRASREAVERAPSGGDSRNRL